MKHSVLKSTIEIKLSISLYPNTDYKKNFFDNFRVCGVTNNNLMETPEIRVENIP